MKKKILVLTLCLMTLIAPVYAENEEAGNDNDNGNIVTTGENENNASARAIEVRALKVTIKANIIKLHQLRLELKTKLQEKKAIINQYKEQEELTEEQRLVIASQEERIDLLQGCIDKLS